ncbi:hypothetical protein ACEPAF_8314 [Sanghuangporus sanghuang]|uniref:Uncharacterized protein n=1 Tax=Sanghuangporus baumii TaxID=108892 RepID=A0A9Q5HRL5_SANBA|nr:hypothetical protein A7U60_g8220 [Sanghuangporus baumii]
MNAQDSDGEADSLFGSPPPSPALDFTRGGSPELALPGAACAILPDLPKNVGTIALPGSHTRSELSDSLPARTPRPQIRQAALSAQSQQLQDRLEEWIGPRAMSAPTAGSVRAKTSKKTKKAKSDVPHAWAGSQISSLLTSVDLPPNFLRYHSQLLGLTGLAGSAGRYVDNRGMSKENPIVVEEDATSHDVLPLQIQQIQSPANATSQVIADTLVSQGSIFPILRSLVPYLGLSTNVGCCNDYTPYQYRAYEQNRSSNITAPPLKRRKLNQVPAGAKDWDVPYPFPANEGPPNYLESWKKKRGKKLMMRLVSLVREAVHKATAKSQMHQSTPNAITESPAAEAARRQVPAMDDDALMTELRSLATSIPATSPVVQESAFSDFFASSPGNVDPAWSFTSDFDSLLGAVNDALSDPNVQLTGNDLAMMSSYPFSPTVSSSPTLSSSTRLPTPSDFTSTSHDSKETDAIQFPDFNFDDISIDPNLLDFSSWPSDSNSAAQTSTELVATGGELLAGMGESSVPWQQDVSAFDQGLWEEIIKNLDSCSTIPLSESTPTVETTPDSTATIVGTQPHGVPVRPADEEPEPSSSVDVPPLPPPSPPSVVHSETSQQHMQSLSKIPLADAEIVHTKRGGSEPSTKRQNRDEVLQRARVRREQLAAEIARAKVELWETTIEQGVLTHLSKDKELQPKP